MKQTITLIIFLTLFAPVFSISEEQFDRMRLQMVNEQIIKRGINDQKVIQALLKVKRHLFVLPQYTAQAYADAPLPIEHGQTISQPYIVAIMTQVIAPDQNKKVLEIGTGSGYQAAVLAEIVKEVYSIEIIPELAQKAGQTLSRLNYKNITLKTGDGYLGWPEFAPFDGIIVTCAPDHVPQPLIDQLAINGRMVIPISYDREVQELILIEKQKDGKLKRTNLIPVRFVPLIRKK